MSDRDTPSPGRITRRRALAGGLAMGAWAVCGSVGASEPRWVAKKQIGPFVCHSVRPIDEVSRDLDALRGLENEVRRVLGLRPCRETIDVLILGGQREHARLLEERHPTAPRRRALFVKQHGRSTVYAYAQDELAIDLRHECTHALLHGDLPMVPLWLDEGLAEYFEPAPLDRPRGPSHLNALRRDLLFGRMLSVGKLEKKYELVEMRGVDYRFAWGWAHFMLHGPREASEQLWEYLGDLRRGEDPGMLSDRLASRVTPLEERFADHFRHWPKVLRAAHA